MEQTKKIKAPIVKVPTLNLIIKQAMTISKNPFPWVKAFSAGIAAFLPVFVGLLCGNIQYGLLAGMGSFTYLYVFNIPYAQRAKKLFFVVLGITFVVALGSISAPYPFVSAILMGLIGTFVVFIFGALKIPGPSAIFFVLVFAMTTGMSVHPELALLRAGLAFLGGVLSWLIAMIGWLFNPYGPEVSVVQRVYRELAALLDSVGTDMFHQARHRTLLAMKEAEDTLAAGYISWRVTDLFKRLYVLNNHANIIFIYITEHFAKQSSKVPSELSASVRKLANSLDQNHEGDTTKILQPEQMDEAAARLFSKIYDADAVLNEPNSKINQVIRISKPSLKTIFGGSFDKNSIVFITSLRYGVILTIAALIAYLLEFHRAYWVPLSCAAVMSGSTIVATYHRAIQRLVGTIAGILIASFVLSFEPEGLLIAFFIFLLTFITELFIVQNYGLAALFFTPNALIMAESTSLGHSFSYFASARIVDVLIGSFIGLIGVLFIGRRSASSRLPHLVGKTLRSQAQFLYLLFSGQGRDVKAEKTKEHLKMQTNLTNLKTIYSTALGEIPINKRAVDYYWPVIFCIDQLAYLLETCPKSSKCPVLSDEDIAQLLLVFESMANAANRMQPPAKKWIPEIEGYSSIQKEITLLQNALLLDERILL